MAETQQNILDAVVYETVATIPVGCVATYGQIAKIIGLPRHARHVGFALSRLTADTTVPWHRVVNSKGELHQRHDGQYTQRQRLADEGILLNERGIISLKHYQWAEE